MPLMRCTVDGKPGVKYGKHGKCYTGRDAKTKAKRQGQAIEINRHSGDKSVASIVHRLLERAISPESDKELTYFTIFKAGKLDPSYLTLKLVRYIRNPKLVNQGDYIRLSFVTTTAIASRIKSVVEKLDHVKSVIVYRINEDDEKYYLSKYGWDTEYSKRDYYEDFRRSEVASRKRIS